MSGKRPLSVSFIAWYIILSNAFSLASTFTLLRNPEIRDAFSSMGMSPTLLLSLSLVSAVIVVALGIAILSGFNWGRIAYLIYYPVTTLAFWKILSLPNTHLNGLILYIVILFFLTRRPANEFFTAS
ncbi:MAG: hypothetical protein AB1420_17805 [Bacillota bacterium]